MQLDKQDRIEPLVLNPTGFELRAQVQRTMSRLMDRANRRKFRPHHYVIEQLVVPVPQLDPIFDDYRIVHITDIHLGQWVSAQRLRGIAQLVNRQKPDAIAMTGDFVSYVLDDVAHALADSLSMLEARDGVFAVLGNHDHWTDASKIRRLLSDSGTTMLDNDVHTLERGNAALHLAGVDSVTVGQDRLDMVLNRLPEEHPAVLLAHEPDFANVSGPVGRFALQLSGHSHGTQMVLPKVGTLIRGPHFRDYPIGRYDVEGMTLYTNRGLGTNVFLDAPQLSARDCCRDAKSYLITLLNSKST